LDTWHADSRDAQDGQSCLVLAVYEGHFEVMKYLIEVGGKELLMLVDKVCVILL
jgi:hypothetical protein